SRPFQDYRLAFPDALDNALLRSGVCFSGRHWSLSAVRPRPEQTRAFAFPDHAGPLAHRVGSYHSEARRILQFQSELSFLSSSHLCDRLLDALAVRADSYCFE